MKTVKCPLCGKKVPEDMLGLHMSTDELVIAKIRRDFPDWSPENGVCEPCLQRYKEKTA